VSHESKFLSNAVDSTVLGMERGSCVDVGYAAVLDDTYCPSVDESRRLELIPVTAMSSRMTGIGIINLLCLQYLRSMDCEKFLLCGREDTSLRLRPALSHVFQAVSMGVTLRFVDQ
jgi:hypothetical protein